MEKKGQAAMEFLMTYGWAILAAIIAIGVLAYFGVFNPGRLAGPAGVVSPPFNLDDFNIVEDPGTNGPENITMVITQNLGQSITLNYLNDTDGSGMNFTLPSGVDCPISDDSPTAAAGLNLLTTGAPPATNGVEAWLSGTQVTLVAVCPDGSWSSGDAVRGDITIRYTKQGSSLTQITQGNLRGPSQ